MGKPYLVGEANPYSSSPADALLPWPRGASGDRMREILGMDDRTYLATFVRVDLCGRRWSMREARAAAERLRAEGPAVFVLLGRKVGDARG